VTELDAAGVSAVFTTDTDLQGWSCLPACVNAHLHEFTHTLTVNDLKWVAREKLPVNKVE
jgi:hypothetical protein